jgi:mRNA interferase RelE/StbE
MSYRLWIKDEAKAEIRELPGHIRQRVRRAVEALASEPRPHSSRELKSLEELEVEPRRIRLDQWRIIYVIDETWSEIGVLAVRRRPPYNYEDLPDLLQELEG